MKFLNFTIENSIHLHVGDRVFDLHNHFSLDSHSYRVSQRIFELAFKGEVSQDSQEASTGTKTDLNMIFKGVDFLRVQDEPLDETHVCFEGIVNLDDETPEKPGMVYQFNNFFSTEEFEILRDEGREIDWKNYFIISFIHGVDILISAETVEVEFTQKTDVLRLD